MKVKAIGAYRTYILEVEDVVVVMGAVDKHSELLAELGFEQHEETKEWLGQGRHLYAMDPSQFFRLFSGREGGVPELAAQATDGSDFYQVDSLPVVESRAQGDRIVEIHALDLQTRAFIDEGVSNFRVG